MQRLVVRILQRVRQSDNRRHVAPRDTVHLRYRNAPRLFQLLPALVEHNAFDVQFRHCVERRQVKMIIRVAMRVKQVSAVDDRHGALRPRCCGQGKTPAGEDEQHSDKQLACLGGTHHPHSANFAFS